MKANPVESTMDEIIDNYRTQLEKYLEILALAKDQLIGAQSGDPPLVDKILDQRQTLIAEIDSLNLNVNELKSEILTAFNIPDFTISELSKAKPDLEQELQIVIAKIGETLIEIIEIDSLNQQALSQSLKGAAEELKKSRSFREVRNAYGNQGPKYQEARFFDRRK